MKAGSIMKMDGEIEADESFIGGLAKNMHEKKRKHIGTGGAGKTAVLGILRRKSSKSGSKVRAKTVPNVRTATLQTEIRENVEPGSRLYTDARASYRGLGSEYTHEVIDHAVGYVRGVVHTNGIENFWSLLKRTIKGTYVSVEPFHLGRYLDEQSFRFNERDDNDLGRFKSLLSSVSGRRLTYGQLIGNDQEIAPT
jgi:transposase-like protein